ncbi:hypothetical protein D3C84_763120 [compost metagenome]
MGRLLPKPATQTAGDRGSVTALRPVHHPIGRTGIRVVGKGNAGPNDIIQHRLNQNFVCLVGIAITGDDLFDRRFQPCFIDVKYREKRPRTGCLYAIFAQTTGAHDPGAGVQASLNVAKTGLPAHLPVPYGERQQRSNARRSQPLLQAGKRTGLGGKSQSHQDYLS